MRMFADDNQYFIRKFNSEVKGFTMNDRSVNYKNKLKNETRERLLSYYKKLESGFQKKEFYSEVIDLFKEFEFELIILSIYFDEDAEYIFKELSPKLQVPIPNYVDKYSLLEFVKDLGLNQYSVSAFHVKYFHQKISLDIPLVPSKNNTLNPEAAPISKWLFSSLQQPNQETEIIKIILHFHKYWQLHFSDPFNYTKAIVLLDKLNGSLNQIQPDMLKTNFFKALTEVKKELSQILPITVPSPFTDTVEEASVRDQIVKTWYLPKVVEFKNILEHTSLNFHDFTTVGLIEIVEKYCSSTERLKSFLMPNILNRFKQGFLPTTEEIAWIRSIRQSHMIVENKMNLELHQQISKHNYIF